MKTKPCCYLPMFARLLPVLLVFLSGCVQPMRSTPVSLKNADASGVASQPRPDSVALASASSGTSSKGSDSPELVLQFGHATVIWNIQLSRDGETLASLGSGDVRLWNVKTGELKRAFYVSTRVIALSPDASLLAVAGAKTVTLYDAQTGAVRCEFDLKAVSEPREVYAMAFSPDGHTLATGGWQHVDLWEVPSGKLVRSWSHVGKAFNIAFSPDGRLLASGRMNLGPEIKNEVSDGGPGKGEIDLWRLNDGSKATMLAGDRLWASAIAFSPDGQTLAAPELGSGPRHGEVQIRTPSSPPYDGGVRLWNVATGQSRQFLQLPTRNTAALAFSPDGKLLATGGADKAVYVWDLQTGKEATPALQGHTREITSLQFVSRDTLLSGSWDASIRSWNVAAGKSLNAWNSPAQTPNLILTEAVAFSPDGQSLMTGGASSNWPQMTPKPGTLTLWDLRTGRLQQRMRGHTYFWRGAIFSPDGTRIVSSSLDNSTILWDTKHGSIVKRLPVSVSSVRFADDSATFSAAAVTFSPRTSTLITWRSRDGAQIDAKPPLAEPLARGLISPDRQTIALANEDLAYRNSPSPRETIIELYDAASKRKITDLHNPIGWLPSLVFSPDSRLLLTGNAWGLVRLWEARTGKLLHTLVEADRDRNAGEYTSFTFTPDSRKLIGSRSDGEATVWDTQTGQIIAQHRFAVPLAGANALSPDSKRACSASGGGSAFLWDVATGRRLVTFQLLPDDKSWIVYTPEGYYDGSPGVEKWIRWRIGNHLEPSAKYAARFHRLDLLQKALRGEPVTAGSSIAKAEKDSK